MEKILLPIARRNELLQIIENNELLPRNFHWDERERTLTTGGGLRACSILHYIDGSYFYFLCDQFEYQPICVPGFNKPVSMFVNLDWVSTVARFKDWVSILAPYAKKPDLWAEINSFQSRLRMPNDETIVSGNAIDDNSPLKAEEVASVKNSLKLIEQKIQDEVNPSPEAKVILKEHLAHAAEASERLTRKDFKVLLYGILIDMVQRMSFEPTSREIAWNIISAGFRGSRALLDI